jgi:4-amino-4-deoxychorismate lyase
MSDRVVAVLGRGVVDPTTPIVRGDDVGLTRGEGIFETLRTRNGRAFLLDEHLDRMQTSAARMALAAAPRAAWAELVAEALEAFGSEDGALRLFTTRGPDGEDAPLHYLTLAPVPQRSVDAREHGAHAITLTLGISATARSTAPWLLGGVKTTSYAVAMAAKRAAEERGATDAIWVSSEGEVLEEATSSVVWLHAGKAYTVPVETGILAGTTLAFVRTLAAAELGVEIADRRTTVDELRGADEAMLLSSVRGIAGLLSLDGAPVGDARVGPLTARAGSAFEAAMTAATSREG